MKGTRTTKGRPVTVQARAWNNDLSGGRDAVAGQQETRVSNGDSMEGQLRKIFVDILACDEEDVTMDAEIRGQLEGDSLDEVEIVIAMEDRMGIVVEEEYDLERLRTFGDWVRMVLEPVGTEV